MKRFFQVLLILAVLFIPSRAFANAVGIDWPAIKSKAWDCNAMVRSVNTLAEPIPFGVFIDDTFGTDDTCIFRLLDTGKVSEFRGHFKWSGHAKVSPSSLIPTAIKFNSWAARYPRVKFRPSAVCENHMTAAESVAMHNALSPYLANVGGWIDSGIFAADPRATRELHGNRKAGNAPWISQDGGDNDGNGVFDVDTFDLRNKASEAYLLWDTSGNCKFSNKDKRAPRARTDCPSQDEFNSMIRLTYGRPPYPAGIRPNEGRIWKPYSDNHGGCKGKDCKALWITNPFPAPQRGRFNTPDKVRVYATNGALVDEFSCYRGTTNCNDKRNWLDGKQPRYYSRNTSFWIGQRAEILSRSQFVVVDEGRARFIINPYQREGLQR